MEREREEKMNKLRGQMTLLEDGVKQCNIQLQEEVAKVRPDIGVVGELIRDKIGTQNSLEKVRTEYFYLKKQIEREMGLPTD